MKPYHNKETNYMEFEDFNINLNNMVLSFAKDNTTNMELNAKQNAMLTAMQHKVINDRSIIETLVINPNNVCLGRCVYCYNENSNNVQSMQMSKEQFVDAITRLKKEYTVGHMKVIRFFGGEPILNPHWDWFISYMYENGLIDTSTDILISSGLLFDSTIFLDMVSKLTYLKERYGLSIKVSASVDFGMEPFTRQNIVGVTQDILVNRVLMLCNHGIPTAFTTNVTHAFDLSLFKKQLKDAYAKFSVDAREHLFMRVSIVAHDTYTPSAEQVEALADALVELQSEYPITTNLFSFDFVLDGGKITKIDDSHFLIVYYPFYCGMYSQMMEIFPDGSFGACHMDITNKNHVLTEDNVDYELMFSNECAVCQNRLFCRNGCTNRRKLVSAVDKRKIYCLWMEKCYMLSWDRIYNKYKKLGVSFKDVVLSRSEKEWESCRKMDC